MRYKIWTPAEVALLRKLAKKRLLAIDISARIPGTTKNSVIGKCYREGIPLAPTPAAISAANSRAATGRWERKRLKDASVAVR
jgi:hypothetical protein